jgi:hypothetical protein
MMQPEVRPSPVSRLFPSIAYDEVLNQWFSYMYPPFTLCLRLTNKHRAPFNYGIDHFPGAVV